MPIKRTSEEISMDTLRKYLIKYIYNIQSQIAILSEEITRMKQLTECPTKTLYETEALKDLLKISEQRSDVIKRDITNTGFEKIFTVDEVADILSISPKTLHRWIKAGKISAVIMPKGNGYRFTSKHLHSWLDKRTIKSSSF